MSRTVQGVVADAFAGGSISIASFSWLAPVTDFFQLVATLVGITAGVYSFRWHRIRIKLAKEKLNVKSNRESTGGASRSTGDDSTRRD